MQFFGDRIFNFASHSNFIRFPLTLFHAGRCQRVVVARSVAHIRFERAMCGTPGAAIFRFCGLNRHQCSTPKLTD